jgi:hypothetical protein
VAAHAAGGGVGFVVEDGTDDAGVRLPRGRQCVLAQRAATTSEVEEGDPIEDVDEELERGVAGEGGQPGVQGAVVAHLCLFQRAQLGGVFIGQPFGGELRRNDLQDDARLENLVEAGVGPV